MLDHSHVCLISLRDYNNNAPRRKLKGKLRFPLILLVMAVSEVAPQ